MLIPIHYIQVVIRTLTRIRERLTLAKNTKGVIVFAGVDEYNTELMEVFDLKDGVRLDLFYYNCSNKFDVEFASQYLQQHDGSIVFANGNECLIYSFEEGAFRMKKHITANLQKRQKKGGMSSLRIARLAEESRHSYVVRVVDYLNALKTKNNWLFGSVEITGLILGNKALLTRLRNGGFLDFNASTICDQKKYLAYLQDDGSENSQEAVLKDILYYLDTNPDMLDFEVNRRETMKAYLIKDPTDADLLSDKCVKLLHSSQHYVRLRMFDYVGLKYFSFDQSALDSDDIHCEIPDNTFLDTPAEAPSNLAASTEAKNLTEAAGGTITTTA